MNLEKIINKLDILRFITFAISIMSIYKKYKKIIHRNNYLISNNYDDVFNKSFKNHLIFKP